MELAGKALCGQLSGQEHERFEKLLSERPDMRRQFDELEREVAESKLDQLWERGLRVLLRVPQSDDVQFLESVKKSDPRAWRDFLRAAFALRVMAKSLNKPLPASVSGDLSVDEERELFTTLNKAMEERKRREAEVKSRKF